jgi:hypothetical protein
MSKPLSNAQRTMLKRLYDGVPLFGRSWGPDGGRVGWGCEPARADWSTVLELEAEYLVGRLMQTRMTFTVEITIAGRQAAKEIQ